MTVPRSGLSDGTRRSVYFDRRLLEEVKGHAFRLERSVSWVVDYAWRHGREAIEQMQGPAESEAVRASKAG